MPSPDVSQPEQSPHDLPAESPDADAEHHGDVSEPPTEQGANGPVPEAIAEGKQNAKTVLAASGVSAEPGQEASDGNESSDSQSNGTNGSGLSKNHPEMDLPVQQRPYRCAVEKHLWIKFSSRIMSIGSSSIQLRRHGITRLGSCSNRNVRKEIIILLFDVRLT